MQYLAEQFWVRWKREYLPTLQARQRCRHGARNVQVGDIVLLVEADAPRGTWPLARVVETRPSGDGRVRKALVKRSYTILPAKRQAPVTDIIFSTLLVTECGKFR